MTEGRARVLASIPLGDWINLGATQYAIELHDEERALVALREAGTMRRYRPVPEWRRLSEGITKSIAVCIRTARRRASDVRAGTADELGGNHRTQMFGLS